MDNSKTEWLDEKYEMLIDAISSNNNTSGVKGCFIKSGEFRKIYNNMFPRHPDYRGFAWNSYIKSKAKSGYIKIFKTHPNGKNHYYVLNDKIDLFLEIYPDGVSAI